MRKPHGNTVIDVFNKFQDDVNKIVGTVIVMQNIIKGLDAPCCLCVGCLAKDNRKGICKHFILKGDL